MIERDVCNREVSVRGVRLYHVHHLNCVVLTFALFSKIDGTVATVNCFAADLIFRSTEPCSHLTLY